MPIDIPMRFASEPLLWTVDDVLTRDECREQIARIEAAAPTIATNNPIYRDQDRVIVDDPALAALLFERLRSSLPAAIGPLRIVGLNDRLRMYRYSSGQRFAPHTDHWYQPSPQRITLHTVLVYLNDDFEGGETRFMEHVDAVVTPRAGRVAIFQHKVRHEGCEVRRGAKYAIRSDVLFEADEPVLLLRS